MDKDIIIKDMGGHGHLVVQDTPAGPAIALEADAAGPPSEGSILSCHADAPVFKNRDQIK